MAASRQRSRASGTRTRSESSGPVASRYRGAAGRKQMREEQKRIKKRREQRQQQYGQPRRFWMPYDGWVPQGRRGRGAEPATGERRIVVLDNEPEFFRYEHEISEKNGDTVHYDCLQETQENCPVCDETGNQSYYALFLTVLDLEGYEDKNGNRVPWSRKLFVVKAGMQRTWVRQFENHGSLRGRIFTVIRDNDKSPRTGNEIVDTGKKFSEKKLATYINTYKDRNGKTHTEDCSQPYNYDELFPPMTREELERAVGADPTPGSRRHESRNLDDDDLEDDAIDDDWADDSKETKASKTKRAKSRSKDDDEEDEEEEDDDVEDDEDDEDVETDDDDDDDDTEDDDVEDDDTDDEDDDDDDDDDEVEVDDEEDDEEDDEDDEDEAEEADEDEPEEKPTRTRAVSEGRSGRRIRTTRTRTAPEKTRSARPTSKRK